MSATATPSHNVSISDIGPSRKKLSFTIPADVVTGKLKDSLDTLALEAQLPGFRKGKAPRQLIEKRFGGMLKTEARSALVTTAYQAAVEEHKLKVVGEPVAPDLEGKELTDGKSFAFDLEVEVVPEFELPSLEGIEVRKPLLDVPETAVDDEVNKVRVNEGSLESRDSASPGDYLTGHGIMKGADGTEHYNIKGCVVQKPAADKAGKGMILGVLVEDFEKQLGAPKAGDTVTVQTKGPDNHEVEAIRGAALTITFTVERIDSIIPAPINDIVKMFGMESEEQLKNAIRQRLQQRIAVQQQVAMRQQAAKHLIDHTKFELPQRLTATQAGRTLENRRMELMYRGVDPQQIEEHMAELRQASSAVAVRDLKLFFILTKASEKLAISVDENEINNRIAQMAFERNLRPEKLRNEIIQRNQVGTVYNQIREHKTMDAILAKAKVTELPVDEYNKAMKAQNEATV
ncbi:MAG: trigger factor [Planctomycetota bacterium]